MPKKVAIVIGLETYRDAKGVPYAKNDAKGMASVLAKLGADVRHTLIDQHATREDILRAVNEIAGDLEQHDTCFFFYAGHGIKPENNKNYITAWNYNKKDPIGSSIPLQEIFDILQKSKCRRVILFVDACFSGMPLQDIDRQMLSELDPEQLVRELKDSEYYCCFASSRGTETSWPDPSLKHGIWTYYLIEALLGRAKDAMFTEGVITAESLQKYLHDSVYRHVKNVGFTGSSRQNPVSNEMRTKDFVIAEFLPSKTPDTAHFKGSEITEVELTYTEEKSISWLTDYTETKLAEAIRERAIEDEDDDDEVAKYFASGDVTADIEEKFQLLRSHLRLPKKEIDISDPSTSRHNESYTGSLATATFVYEITISGGDKSGQASIKRSVSPLDLSVLKDPLFNSAFGDIFRIVVFKFSEPVEVEPIIHTFEDLAFDRTDCDRNATYVSMEMEGAQVWFESDEISVLLPKRSTATSAFQLAVETLRDLELEFKIGLDIKKFEQALQ